MTFANQFAGEPEAFHQIMPAPPTLVAFDPLLLLGNRF
jgi:hypothetical protein